ncbi:hypothetical protein THAOC_13967, partial [Thalassiosira oceanica]
MSNTRRRTDTEGLSLTYSSVILRKIWVTGPSRLIKNRHLTSSRVVATSRRPHRTDMITPDEVRLRLIMGGVDELVAHPRCTSTSPRVYANITSYHRPTLKHKKDQRSIEWTEKVNETLLELAAEDLASRPAIKVLKDLIIMVNSRGMQRRAGTKIIELFLAEPGLYCTVGFFTTVHFRTPLLFVRLFVCAPHSGKLQSSLDSLF